MIYNFDDLSFQILTVDRFYHKVGFFDIEARPYAAFSFRVSGTGRFEVANRSFTVKEGDVLFLPANTPYKVEYSVSESIVVHFTDCNYDEAESISLENQAAIEVRFGQLLESWREKNSVNAVKAGVYEILERISNDKKMAMSNTAFANSVRYMEEHFCDPELDIEAVCRFGFMSASGMQRAFLKHFGISPKQYLTKLRMTRALTLLAEGEISVKEIAETCGFRDEKYFSRSFKKKYGYPPSHFSRKLFV